MTITTLLMILALAVGSGTPSQPVSSDSMSCPFGRACKIAGECWVNGQWTTPCPDGIPEPRPSPEILIQF